MIVAVLCFKRGQLREYFTLTLHLSANVCVSCHLTLLPALATRKEGGDDASALTCVRVQTSLRFLIARHRSLLLKMSVPLRELNHPGQHHTRHLIRDWHRVTSVLALVARAIHTSPQPVAVADPRNLLLSPPPPPPPPPPLAAARTWSCQSSSASPASSPSSCPGPPRTPPAPPPRRSS